MSFAEDSVMSQIPETPSTLPSDQLRPRTVAYALFALSLVLAGLTIWLFAKYQSEVLWLGLWTASLAVLALAGAAWQWLWDPEVISAQDSRRIMILTGGGVAGLATVI